MAERSTKDVFEDHLDLSLADDLETDLTRNYAHDVVMLSHLGVFYGHDGIRQARDILKKQLPDASYHYLHRLHENDVAFLVWRGESKTANACDGVDSFVIREGKIRIQTVHYRVVKRQV